MTTLIDPDVLPIHLLPMTEPDGVTILDLIHGTGGDDTLQGTNGNDNLRGLDGDDLIFGGAGNDLISGGHGRDTVDGGAGDDTIAGDRQADSLFGGAGDDLITASSKDNSFNPTETLGGGDGNDTIYGSFNPDLIDGGRGQDVIHLTAGPDTIDGGRGTDTVVYGLFNGATIDLAAGTADVGVFTATLVSIENVEGGGFADTIAGDSKANVLSGEDGSDTLSGAGGDDSLHGGEGGDRIIGGLGADVLEGGGGPDTFLYAHTVESDAAHTDTILDLVAGDTIDLTGIDADLTEAHDQAFHLVAGGLTGEAGELTLVYDAGSDTTLLEGDVDGDGNADLLIRLNGDQTDFTGLAL